MRALAVALLVAALGCRNAPSTSQNSVIRLVDLKPSFSGDRPVPAVDTTRKAEWRFDGQGATPAWKAGPGISGLTLRNGKLVGRTTTATALISLGLPPSNDRDVVHEVQIRLQVTAGANLSLALRPADTVDLVQEASQLGIIPWPFNSPVIAGPETQTYTARSPASIRMAQRHLLIRPTDIAGASFEIESVRVVSRREHLKGIPSGLGWQGLGEVYRETLVARAPETIRFDVELPRRPRLEFAVGTIEEPPVTFRVGVRTSGEIEDARVFERTVTTAHRWETARVELDRFAGQKVTVSLEIAADTAGALGLWGTPTIPEDARPAASGKAADRPQGVILIWADTLRRDHLPFYGYSRATAPVLQRMATEGTVFEDCIAQADWTKASGPSLLTSLYPTTTTVQQFNDVLPSSGTTIAEVYRQAGYRTLSLTSIPFVGKGTNLHQGFEELHEVGAYPEAPPPNAKTSRAQVDRLVAWLESHEDTPFFVLLHMRDPHSPFKPSAPYDSLWADPSRRDAHEREGKAVQPLIKNPNMRPRIMPTRDELARAGVDPDAYISYEKDWYDGSIRAMDTEVGRLREQLTALGLDKRTLVAFMSDHGEEFLEHGDMFHQQSPYGEIANVPLFFWWPGRVPAGARVEPTVQNIDVMPTLIELSGLAAPAGVQGKSLAPFFGGKPSWSRPAVIEAMGRPDPTSTHNDAIGIIMDGYKLVYRPKPSTGYPAHELFDHGQDPLDRVNIASSHPEIVARLSRELEAWRKMATAARLKPDAAVTGTMRAEDLERLRALGYVQ